MKRLFILLLSAVLAFGACQEKSGTEPVTPVGKINISLGNVKGGVGSITATVTAMGVHKEAYNSWGVTYGETSDKALGTDFVAEGKPSDGSVEIVLEGLKEEAAYYLWAWAEADGTERQWSNSPAKALTKTYHPSDKLSGTVIGSTYSVDYNTGGQSLTVNVKENVFDGNFETFFASYDRSGTWVGLDLGTKHVINKIGYSPRITQEHRVQLAVIEGANEPDFSDAIPIHMIKNSASSGVMHHEEVECSRGFRYVRYVSPNDVRCNLAELEFYGYQGEGSDAMLYQVTNLPTVVINTPGMQDITSKEYELSSNVYIISENGTNLLATSETGVRGRGNASWLYFPKKPFRLKFKSKQSPLGAPASAKKWTLISNYSDKSLMRNILAYKVSEIVGQAFTPFITPVDVIVNGEYRGCYQFCDQVEAAKDRVPAKDGYLIEVDNYAYDETVMFTSKNGTPVTIKHPDEDDITQEQWDFIEDYYNKMEGCVLSSDFDHPERGYHNYLDVESFLRNFIVGEFCGNPDMLWSVYMYKDAGDGKLYVGPTWDHDLSFDNDYTSHPINDLGDYVFCTKGRAASNAIKRVTERIVKENPEAKARLVELWNEAYDAGIKNMPQYLDETYLLLKESQELNFKRWPVLNEKVHMNFQALGSYDAEVQFVRRTIVDRLYKFDEYVNRK